jgi:hypothetical protein
MDDSGASRLAVAGAEDEGFRVGGLAGLHARVEELRVALVEFGAGGAPAVLHGGGDGLLEALLGGDLEAVVLAQVLAEAQVGGVLACVLRGGRAGVRRAETQGFGAAGVEPADCACMTRASEETAHVLPPKCQNFLECASVYALFANRVRCGRARGEE